MNIDYCSSPETICLQCGNKGFTNAFVYCVKCLQFAVHRYCLSVMPESSDEFVRWVCDDCEIELVERCPKFPKKKKLSIDHMTLSERISQATRKKNVPQTSDSQSAMTERSTLLNCEAKIKSLKKKASKIKRDKLLKMRSSITKKSKLIKRLRATLYEESAAKDELTREMERMKQEHARALAVARFEGARAFKESLTFQECVVVRALDIYEHGFNMCVAQAKRARAFRKGFDASLLDPCKDERLQLHTEVEDEPEIEGEFAELVD